MLSVIDDGRESITPERLLRALLLRSCYSIRSERQLIERIDHDLLFRWFVGRHVRQADGDSRLELSRDECSGAGGRIAYDRCGGGRAIEGMADCAAAALLARMPSTPQWIA
jgi:transposase